jgi:cellulose synthase/poly-beta-1,6-N-acetylglucosamine synthase-like glycosyltransferase
MTEAYHISGFILLILLGLNSVLFVICNRPSFSPMRRRPSPAAPRRRGGMAARDGNFVSIHLAVHDEPADVVIATLAALRNLHHPRFEVVVIDNNTPSPATWRPVRDYCRCDPRLRFYHFSGVKGAKAGALNIALKLMDPAADYVAVVDADYQVIPEFLDIAVDACENGNSDFVQFPQAYRGTEAAAAIDRELSDYFAVFSSRASNVGAMLPTGTLSLIRTAVLRSVGGWPTSSITEDAEIGMRMWRMGATGRYVDQVVGRGMLPLDLHGLRCQRYRWAAGNARTLIHHLRAGVRNWPVHGRWAVIAQLTAWIGFGAAPLLALVAAFAIQPAGPAAGQVWQWVETLAAINLLAVLLALVVTAFARGRPETLPVKLALFWTSSFAWLPQLWHSATPFLRTPKGGARLSSSLSLETTLSVIALVVALGYLRIGHVFTGLVLAGSASTLLVSPLVDRALRQAGLAQTPCAGQVAG